MLGWWEVWDSIWKRNRLRPSSSLVLPVLLQLSIFFSVHLLIHWLFFFIHLLLLGYPFSFLVYSSSFKFLSYLRFFSFIFYITMFCFTFSFFFFFSSYTCMYVCMYVHRLKLKKTSLGPEPSKQRATHRLPLLLRFAALFVIVSFVATN